MNHPILADMFVSDQTSEGLVFAGGIPPFDERRVPEIFGDSSLCQHFKNF